MNYLDQLSQAIRAEVPKSGLPNDDTRALFRNYAVLLLAVGHRVTASDVHNAWVAWMSDRDPNHVSLVKYEDLPPEVAREDERYAEAIRRVAQSSGSNSTV